MKKLEQCGLPQACSCPKTACQHHSLCCQCVAAHIRLEKKPPVCMEALVARIIKRDFT